MDLALGTAQWGSGYGLTNTRGRLSDDEVAAIIATARDLGIVAVDTHRTSKPEQGYGAAQSRLRPWAREFAITTKVFGGAAADLSIIEQLRASLSELGIDELEGCLIHDWYELSEAQAVAAASALEQAKALGLVRSVGVSAYSVLDVERAVEIFANLGAVQVPASVLDQRFVAAPVMASAHAAGVRVQVRSVLLQGLLLEPELDSPLAAHPDVIRFHESCALWGRTALEACLSFIRSVPWVDHVIVGVTSAQELSEIGRAWAADDLSVDWSALASQDADLVDPRRWKR